MLNISKHNYILELVAFDKPWGIYSVQDQDGQKVIITNNIGEMEEKLNKWGYENIHNSEYGYLVNSYGAKPEKFKEIVNKYFPGKSIFEDTNIKKLKKELNKLRNMSMISEPTEQGNMIKTWMPHYAVYQRNVVSLKIPTYFSYDDDFKWDYDYLIYPLTDMFNDSIKYNLDLLMTLNKYCQEENKIDETVLPHILEDSLLTCFTPNRYRLAQFEFALSSMYTKGIIRILRNLPPTTTMESRFYDIYQGSRMAKTEKLEYMEIRWDDKTTNETTFPKLVELMTGLTADELDGLTLEEVTGQIDELIETMEMMPKKEQGYHMTYEALKAIKQYKMMAAEEDINVVVAEYEKRERMRESIREKLFYMNLNLRCRIEDIVALYKKTEMGMYVGLSILDFRITNQPIKITFSKKSNVISMTGGSELEWGAEYIF